MSLGKRSRVKRNLVKPLVVAVALALPGTAAFAATMTNVVTTRSDQNVEEQYGRDSVYAFSRDAKPFKPEQQGARDTGFIGNAFDKTTGFVAGAWHKTTSLFTDDGKSYAASPYQYAPERYGRAGGYAGSDRVAVIGGATNNMATANSDAVKTGEELDYAAARRSDDQTPSAVNEQDTIAQDPSTALNNPSIEPGVITAPVVEDQSAGATMPDEPSSALNQDQGQPVITAPVVEEQAVIERDTVIEPSAADSTKADSDVVHASPLPPSDNGRVDSDNTAATQDEMKTQAR